MVLFTSITLLIYFKLPKKWENYYFFSGNTDGKKNGGFFILFTNVNLDNTIKIKLTYL